MFQVAGLTFHWYGLILGVAIAVGWSAIIFQAARHKIETDFLENSFLWLLLGGILGARAYHILTDWPRYIGHWLNVFAIWQGGLSIIGAVIGGLLTLWLLMRSQPQMRSRIGAYLDLCAFGLPLAQAIGRLGNWANQELYGLPTQLPWKLYIDQAHRLPGYENISFYQPLFAYEAVFLILFAVAIWGWDRFRQPLKIGSGRLFVIYVAYYCLVRFGLDFLRIDTVRLPGIWVSVNQVIMLVVLSISGLYLLRTKSNYGLR